MDLSKNKQRYVSLAALINIHEIASGVINNVAGNEIASTDPERLHGDINAAIGRNLKNKGEIK